MFGVSRIVRRFLLNALHVPTTTVSKRQSDCKSNELRRFVPVGSGAYPNTRGTLYRRAFPRTGNVALVAVLHLEHSEPFTSQRGFEDASPVCVAGSKDHRR